MKLLRTLVAAAAIAAVQLSSAALAADYPERTIRLINPWAPGGPTDVIARPLADKLSAALGQTVVMENRVGANGQIAHEYVASARPDGYTVLLTHAGPMAITPALGAELKYDPVNSFAPITLFTSQQLVLGVRPDLPIENLEQFIEYAKNNPGMIYGSVGIGSTTHLAVEWIKSATGIEVTHVPYNGATPLMTDMLGGRVHFAFLAVASFVPYLDRIRPIALSTTAKSALLPEVPAAADVIPGFELASWYGLAAPAGTPKDIVDRLAEETTKILQDPEMLKVLADVGMTPGGGSPEEHAKMIVDELALWSDLAEKAGLKK